MAKRKPTLLGSLKMLDGYSRAITGKPLPEIISNVIDLFGTEAVERGNRSMPLDPLLNDYVTLGADLNWSDAVIKSVYRAQVKECHPDGNKPDPEKFKKLTDAFQNIMKARKEA